MATEVIGLDLFVILVEYVAGSIFLALLIWAAVLLVTAIMGRLSMQSTLIIIITYLAVASVGYIGALAAVPLTIYSAWYMISGIMRGFNQPM